MSLQYLFSDNYSILRTTIVGKKHLEDIYGSIHAQKNSFRASKWLRKFRPKKLPKIVNCATIKEIEKLKERMVGVQVE
jgi:hypothetical protein